MSGPLEDDEALRDEVIRHIDAAEPERTGGNQPPSGDASVARPSGHGRVADEGRRQRADGHCGA